MQSLHYHFDELLVEATLKIYSTEETRESILQERAVAYLKCSPKERVEEIFALYRTAVLLNNNQPLKQPQDKGLVIRKP